MYTTNKAAYRDMERVHAKTELEVEGELTVTHQDMEELYTIFTDDRYDGKGLELQGKHIIKLPKPMYLLDAEVFHPLTKGETKELIEVYTKYTEQLKYRYSWASFRDRLNKLCTVLWLLLVMLFLFRM